MIDSDESLYVRSALDECCVYELTLREGATLFTELCWGKAMEAYTKPQERKKKVTG